jgi:hypothetical protein
MPKTGICKFTISVLKVGLRGIRIGLARKGYDPKGKIGRDDISWSVHSHGKKYHNNVGEAYIFDIKKGDIVTIVLDRDTGSLKFCSNDHDYGIAFTDCEKLKNYELYPAV